MSQKRTELEQSYIGGLGVVAIALFSNLTFELARWPCAAHWKQEEIVALLCFDRLAHAELVMCGLMTVPADKDEAFRLLGQAVDGVGATWKTVDDVVATAQAATAEIEMHITAWNRSGGLSDFNAAYKRHRKLCLATSNVATSYSDYLHAFKMQIMRAVGENIAAGRDRFFGVMDMRPDALPDVKTGPPALARQHQIGGESGGIVKVNFR